MEKENFKENYSDGAPCFKNIPVGEPIPKSSGNNIEIAYIRTCNNSICGKDYRLKADVIESRCPFCGKINNKII